VAKDAPRKSLLSDLLLAAHGIDRDDAPLQVQDLDECWDGRDLVALLIDCTLAKHHAVHGGSGADHVKGRFALRKRGPEGLPIQGHDIARNLLPHIADPGEEAFPKSLGIKQDEDPVERVRARHAVGQGKEGLEPVPLGFGETMDVLPTVGPTKHGQYGYEEDIEEDMPLTAYAAGIGQGFEVADKAASFGSHG